MQIRYRETLGFAGVQRGCELDTEELPSAQRDRLIDLVDESRLADAPTPRGRDARDASQYEIEIEDDDDLHAVHFDDTNLPDRVTPLLEFLREHAKPLSLD